MTARTRGDWNIFCHGMVARIALKSSRVLLTVDLLNYRYLTVFQNSFALRKIETSSLLHLIEHVWNYLNNVLKRLFFS